jgi:hypothetical protein
MRQKNKKKCKINSRNFTYDGLTFSTSFLLEVVKDEIWSIYNTDKVGVFDARNAEGI